MRNFLAKQISVSYRSANGRLLLPISILVLVLYLLSIKASFSQTSDEQQWWFNIELIAFSRVMSPSNTEDFLASEFSIDYANSHPLLEVSALRQRPRLDIHYPVCDAVYSRFESVDLSFERTDNMVVSNDEAEANNPNNETTDIDDLPAAESTESTLSARTLLQKVLNTHTLPLQYVGKERQAPQLVSSENTSVKNFGLERVEGSTATFTPVETRYETLQRIEEKVKKINRFYKNLALSQRLECIANNDASTLLKQPVLAQMPKTLFASTPFFNGQSQLISDADIALQDYAKSVFRQRDIKPLLYTAWRHNVVFGAQNAEFFRVKAGKLLSIGDQKVEGDAPIDEESFQQWNQQYFSKQAQTIEDNSTSLFASLQSAISKDEPVDWLSLESTKIDEEDIAVSQREEYELDGKFKVYLDYVNQVPYLHIESEFAHHRLALDKNGLASLQTYSSKQRRRIISKQIHYFDHPAFGIIVRLERFTPPQPNETQNL
jgi:hypothetical protein